LIFLGEDTNFIRQINMTDKKIKSLISLKQNKFWMSDTTVFSPASKTRKQFDLNVFCAVSLKRKR